MFTRIRWRLVGWNMVVLGVIILLLGGTVYLLLANGLTVEVDRNLASRGEEIAGNLHEFTEQTSRLGEAGYHGGLFYLALDSQGQVLANPQGVNLRGLSLVLPAQNGATNETVVLDGEPTRLYMRREEGLLTGPTIVVVGQSLVVEQNALRRLQIVLLAGGGAGLLLSLVGAWFLAGRALVPIQTAFRRQQEFVADAAHELRTPLSVLRSAVDLLDRHSAEPLQANRELLDDVRDEITWLEGLAADLLLLARADVDQLGLTVALLDMAVLAGDVVRRATPLAQSRDIALTCQLDVPSLAVEGDPDRLQQVLLILLDNALQHTPPRGRVAVVVQRQDGQARIQVADTGEGIPAEHLAHVFDRFYRGDHARSGAQRGTGLGLAIARALVEAHHGQLSVVSTVGRGTTVTMRLPVCERANTGTRAP